MSKSQFPFPYMNLGGILWRVWIFPPSLVSSDDLQIFGFDLSMQLCLKKPNILDYSVHSSTIQNRHRDCHFVKSLVMSNAIVKKRMATK